MKKMFKVLEGFEVHILTSSYVFYKEEIIVVDVVNDFYCKRDDSGRRNLGISSEKFQKILPKLREILVTKEYTMYLVKLTEESTGTIEKAFLHEEQEKADQHAEVWNEYQLKEGGDCMAKVHKILIKELD